MPGSPPNVPREGTYLESDADIRQAIQARQARQAGTPQRGQKAEPAPAEGIARLDLETRPERPRDRPALALLCILDDGRADGEWVRLRSDRYVIGRSEGTICIPHDSLISGRHAELVRQKTAIGFRWVLVDQKSTNGTFVRVGSSVLTDQSEFLVGRGRFRFDASTGGEALAGNPAEPPPGGTMPWAGGSVRSLFPSLVEITPAGMGQRMSLTQAEYWIGREPGACAILRPDDPLLNARHARLHRDAKAQWHIENNKSVNGLWLRVDQIPLTGNCQFRTGEQRFLFRVL